MKKIQFWVISESSEPRTLDREEGSGPMMLATISKKYGFSNQIYQASWFGNKAGLILKKIQEENPEIVAFSIYSGGISLLRDILSALPKSKTILLGGPGVTIDAPALFPEMKQYNFERLVMIAGEAEQPFERLFVRNDWQKIPEIYFADREGSQTGKFNTLKNMDDKPFPDLGGSELRKYCEEVLADARNHSIVEVAEAVKILQHAYIESRRGCINHCAFCSEPELSVRGVRRNSVKRTIEEIKYLYETFGITFFNFSDNIAFDNAEWWLGFVAELAQYSPRNLLQFGGFGTPKINVKDIWLNKVFPELSKVGFSFITLGVQAGSKRILRDIINRPADDPENALVIVKKLIPLGVNVKTDFIVGHPTETVGDLQEEESWIQQIYQCGGVVSARRLNVMPHSKYEELLQQGWLALPEKTAGSEAIIARILAYHADASQYKKLLNEMNRIPNLHFIDRSTGLRFPKLNWSKELLREQVKLVKHLPELIRYRYQVLFDRMLSQ